MIAQSIPLFYEILLDTVWQLTHTGSNYPYILNQIFMFARVFGVIKVQLLSAIYTYV